jgi:hypothetical protein
MNLRHTVKAKWLIRKQRSNNRAAPERTNMVGQVAKAICVR